MELPESSLASGLYRGTGAGLRVRQKSDHPKDGLFLYGPHAGPARSREISVGVIGTKEGLSYFRNWAIRLGGFVAVPPPKKTDKEHRLHLSNFPGSKRPSGCSSGPASSLSDEIDTKSLDDATRTLNRHEAVRKAVDLYVAEIENTTRTRKGLSMCGCSSFRKSCSSAASRFRGVPALELTKGDFSKKQKKVGPAAVQGRY